MSFMPKETMRAPLPSTALLKTFLINFQVLPSFKIGVILPTSNLPTAPLRLPVKRPPSVTMSQLVNFLTKRLPQFLGTKLPLSLPAIWMIRIAGHLH